MYKAEPMLRIFCFLLSIFCVVVKMERIRRVDVL